MNQVNQTKLQSILANVTKKFGKESMMKLDSKRNLDIPNIPSQIMSLDLALGIGGLPKGRIIELYGDGSSGKTTQALNFIAQCQKAGGVAVFIDAEHALDPKWAKKRGVDLESLLVAQPECGEEALEILEEAVEGGVDIAVVDSVAALIPRAELEKEMGESSMGLQARLMSQALRKLVGLISRKNTVVIFINQTRDKIGVSYGNPTTTTSGNALKFYSTIRCEFARKETLKKGEEAIGVKTRVKIVKNKVAPPFTECTFDLFFNSGFDFEGSIVEESIKYDIIKKSGAWFTYGTERFQGSEKVKTYIKEKGLVQELRKKVMEEVEKKGYSDDEVKLEETTPIQNPEQSVSQNALEAVQKEIEELTSSTPTSTEQQTE